MKKNRNSFFTETNVQSGMMPNPNQMVMPNQQIMPNQNMMPYQSANSYFYQGPTNPYNYNIQNNDLESRLAKIERQINRLEHRISTLENNTNILSTEDYESTSTNMYMV